MPLLCTLRSALLTLKGCVTAHWVAMAKKQLSRRDAVICRAMIFSLGPCLSK